MNDIYCLYLTPITWREVGVRDGYSYTAADAEYLKAFKRTKLIEFYNFCKLAEGNYIQLIHVTSTQKVSYRNFVDGTGLRNYLVYEKGPIKNLRYSRAPDLHLSLFRVPVFTQTCEEYLNERCS